MALSIRETGENIKNSILFKGTVDFDVPMADFTTMKVGGLAELVVRPADPISLAVAASVTGTNRTFVSASRHLLYRNV